MDQHLGGQQTVDLVGGQGLVVKDLSPPLILPGLAALQHAVLVGEHQRHAAGGGEQLSAAVRQADLVLKAGIGVRQERPVADGPAEAHLVKDQDPVGLCEKPGPGIGIRQQQTEQAGVHSHGGLIDGIPQKRAVLRHKAGVLRQKRLKGVK